MTDTPTLHLERVSEGPVFVHGWLVGDGVRCAIALPPAAFAALESALDGSWADTILRQRDEAITERDAARVQATYWKGRAEAAWDQGDQDAAERISRFVDRRRSAAEQDVIAAAREFFAKYEWVYRADQEHLAVIPALSSHERFRLFAAVDALDSLTGDEGGTKP